MQIQIPISLGIVSSKLIGRTKHEKCYMGICMVRRFQSPITSNVEVLPQPPPAWYRAAGDRCECAGFWGRIVGCSISKVGSAQIKHVLNPHVRTRNMFMYPVLLRTLRTTVYAVRWTDFLRRFSNGNGSTGSERVMWLRKSWLGRWINPFFVSVASATGPLVSWNRLCILMFEFFCFFFLVGQEKFEWENWKILGMLLTPRCAITDSKRAEK